MRLKLLTRILEKGLTVLNPSLCVFCRTLLNNNEYVCELCKKSLPWCVDRCYRCGLRLHNSTESVLCDRCQMIPPHFDRMCAVFSYQPPITSLITGLKFSSRLDYGRVLSFMLTEAVLAWYKGHPYPFPEAMVPMPLHKKRHSKRGYNQTLELTRELKRALSIPVLVKEVERITHTRAQSGLNAMRRRHNLKDAFKVTLHKPYQHLAIVDDVVTTGSTVNALSLALKEQGVGHVDVWCIARSG